jgi:hypothetical protein
VSLDCRVHFLYTPHISHPRTAVECATELVKLLAGACRVNLNTAVVKVSRPAPQPDFLGAALSKIAESYTLNSSRDEPAARELPHNERGPR